MEAGVGEQGWNRGVCGEQCCRVAPAGALSRTGQNGSAGPSGRSPSWLPASGLEIPARSGFPGPGKGAEESPGC